MIYLPRTFPFFLLLASTSNTTPGTNAFTNPLKRSGMTRKIATRNVDADDAINIKRDWKWDGYEATGDFDVNIFVPDHNMGKGNIKGCAFFIHGFLQGPSAYSCTLQKAAETANVAIIAVKTGICDKHIILEGMGRIPFVRRFNPVSLSFVLQCVCI